MGDNNIDTTAAMLVCLSFTLPRQSVQLREESTKIEQDASASAGTVRASLFYFQKSEGGKKNKDALADLKAYQNAWRSEHARLTRSWDGNTRLLPAALVAKYMDMTKKMEEGYPKEIEKFLEAYPEWAASAPERMGQLYAKSNFPSASEVTGAITHELSYIPLPAAEQFKRISMIAPDMAATMETVTNEKIQKALADAQAQTWKDVLAPIQHVVDTLSKDKSKIYDSLIGNVLSIVELVPAFNLDRDPKLSELAEKAKNELSKVSTDDLRKSDDAKKAALATAKALIDEFEPFARSFNV